MTMFVSRQRSRIGRRSRFLSALLTTTVVASALTGAALNVLPTTAAQAVPGQPGQPSAPAVLYAEDFEVGDGVTNLPAYVGAGGQSYTASPYWLDTSACNGFVVDSEDAWPGTSHCVNVGNFNGVLAKTYALGLLTDPANPATNRALSSNTSDVAAQAPNQIMFATAGQLNLPTSSGRFVTFSVDAAATACGGDQPLLRFYFRGADGTETPISSTAINACTDPRGQAATVTVGGATEAVRYGTFAADSSLLLTGPSVGIVLRNESAGNLAGNDGAIDNIRVLDVTPQLDKVFSPAITETGGTSTLTFTVTNTDELAAKNGWSFADTLPTGLSIADPSGAITDCPAGVVTTTATSVSASGNLSAGQASCTVSVRVTSAVPGTFVNGPANVTEVGLNPPIDTTVVFQAPAITILKAAGTPVDVNGNGITDAGDTIPFSFLVTNTGDVNLTDVVVNDPKVGAVDCPGTSLAVDADMSCTATYTVTTADEATGAVLNTATATGTPPVGTPVTSPPSDTSTPLEPAAPELALVKSADVEVVTAAGQSVAYAFEVTNTGNVPVTAIAIAEGVFTGSGELSDIVCPAGALAVGASVTCDATYVVTQADIDAGGFTNTATATGIPVGDDEPVVSNESAEEVDATQAPSLTIVKSAAITGDDYAVGAEVVYSFVATNTGNTTLTDIMINETSFSGTGELSEIVCPAEEAASLAPAAQVTCEATYALTQADIAAGEVTNTATATGTAPGGDPITSTPDDAVVPIPGVGSVSIVKTADIEQISAVGQVVTYSFVVTNTGDVTVTNPEVVEGDFSGSGELSLIECPADAVLLPGQFVTCAATYEVTQADLDSGQLTNTATATGTTPGGDPTDPSDPSTVELPTDPQPALTVVKTTDKASVVGVGQMITYTFVITNTGNVTILNATVVETRFSGTGSLSAVTCEPAAASLAPGASVDCTATYRTTQADVTAGKVSNTAVASGTPATGGDPVQSNPSTASFTVSPGAILASTGGQIEIGVVGIAILLLLGGGILMAVRRRREEVTTD